VLWVQIHGYYLGYIEHVLNEGHFVLCILCVLGIFV
jgi:hypothetical protein